MKKSRCGTVPVRPNAEAPRLMAASAAWSHVRAVPVLTPYQCRVTVAPEMACQANRVSTTVTDPDGPVRVTPPGSVTRNA